MRGDDIGGAEFVGGVRWMKAGVNSLLMLKSRRSWMYARSVKRLSEVGFGVQFSKSLLDIQSDVEDYSSTSRLSFNTHQLMLSKKVSSFCTTRSKRILTNNSMGAGFIVECVVLFTILCQRRRILSKRRL